MTTYRSLRGVPQLAGLLVPPKGDRWKTLFFCHCERSRFNRGSVAIYFYDEIASSLTLLAMTF